MAVMLDTDQPVWTDSELDRLRALVRAEEGSAWEIGDQLLALLPVGARGVKSGVGAKLRELAAEVDAEPKTLATYRDVAHAWPNTARVGFATWAAHRAYMGPSTTAQARGETLASLQRNEHGKVTVAAVRALTRGASGGRPGWHELLGRVSDTLTRAQKQLDRFNDAVGEERLDKKLRDKASRYADQAEALAAELRNTAQP